MLPNSTQVQTTSASLVALAAGYAASQHWLGLSDEQWLLLIGAAIAAWPAIVTRAKALKNQVGNLKDGSKVITTAKDAAATSSPNVIAETPAINAAIAKS